MDNLLQQIRNCNECKHHLKDGVNPIIAASQKSNPILFIHGDAGNKIPIAFNRNNFNATNSSDKAWITVKGAGHNNVSKIGGENLKNQIMEFINKQRE